MIEPGTLLQNRYRVVKQIGLGGMGAVYLATDERFASTVAVKQTLFDDAALRKAFEREAQLLNHLRHAALPKVSDHFVEGTGQFLVMEFIEGADLSDLLTERGLFPCAEVLQWADELLNALDYLHTQTPPIIHRDIKPQNLKLSTRGQIVLLDFGLAKGTPTQMHASTMASIFGYSRSYAPLEQIQGTGTDARSDLYSLAATLYHLLTGTAPVDALTRASAIINNQPDPLVPAHLVRAEIPAVVGGMLHRAMAQNAARRPQTAAALRAALRQAAVSAQDATPQTPAMHPPVYDGAATQISTSLAGHPASNVTNRAGHTTMQEHFHLPPPDETFITLAARHASSRTRAAPVPAEPPARKSPKLLVAAAVALLVACGSVPFFLGQRTAANPSAAQTIDTTGPTTNIPSDVLSAPTQATDKAPSSLSATEFVPARTSSPATSSAVTAQTNAAPAASDATASGTAANTVAGSDAAGQTTPAGITTAARAGLEIHNPIPAATPDDGSASREAARRAEETRRAADEARRNEDARRIDELLRRAASGPPPNGGPPPPFGGGPPPPPPGRRPPAR